MTDQPEDIRAEIRQLSANYVILRGILVEDRESDGTITVFARGNYDCIPAQAMFEYEYDPMEDPHPDPPPDPDQPPIGRPVIVKLKPDALILQKRVLKAEFPAPPKEGEESREPCGEVPGYGYPEHGSPHCLAPAHCMPLPRVAVGAHCRLMPPAKAGSHCLAPEHLPPQPCLDGGTLPPVDDGSVQAVRRFKRRTAR